MPATKVPTNIANKVIMFPGVLCTPKQTAPMGGFTELAPEWAVGKNSRPEGRFQHSHITPHRSV
jgi:hypothetical protein